MTEQPRTVRLPMYDRYGLVVKGYLELDVDYLINKGAAWIVRPEEKD